MSDYDFLDADPATITRRDHEAAYIARGDVRLTDDEMGEAIMLRGELHRLVDNAAANHSICEYLAARLNRVHSEQSALLHRIKERACIRECEIALDGDFKVVKK